MLGKFAVILGPVLIGSVGLFARSLGFSSSIASRLSITSVSILFLTGGILLFFVDEKKIGKETGYHSSESETGVA